MTPYTHTNLTQKIEAEATEICRTNGQCLGDKKFRVSRFSCIANQLSKQLSTRVCKRALIFIAKRIAEEDYFTENLRQNPKHAGMNSALMANACCKLQQESNCQQAIDKIANFINSSTSLNSICNPQNLANLANAFAKYPGQENCRIAILNIAQCLSSRSLDDFEPQGLANLANAFAKYPGQENCRIAILNIAQYLSSRSLNDYKPQGLANLANTFAKYPDQENCQTALLNIAQQLPSQSLNHFNPQELANLANAFAKCLDQENCQTAILNIAQYLSSRSLDHFNPQDLANLANTFAKCPNQENCQTAILNIAQQLPSQSLGQFNPQDLANLANAFAKCPNQENCQTAILKIAQHLPSQSLNHFNPQELANLANAFAKCPGQENCRIAILNIAQRLPPRSLDHFNPQDLANLANAFAKYPGQENCRIAILNIAQCLSSRSLDDFEPQGLANLANAFAKYPGQENCRIAILNIAQCLSSRSLDDFEPQGLANLANAFAKYPDQENCQTALLNIAQQLPSQSLNHFNPQELANLANAFAKCLDQENCQTAILNIAQYLSSRSLDHFKPQDLANLANTFAKCPDQENCQTAILNIAQHLPSQSLVHFKPQDLANLANTLAKCPDQENCRIAILNIAQQLPSQSLDRFNPQDLANLANAFAKCPDQENCQTAILNIAQQLPPQSLGHFKPQELANLANAFAKYPDQENCQTALLNIAQHLPSRSLDHFNPQNLANLVNAFAKYPDQEHCKQAITQTNLYLSDDNSVIIQKSSLLDLAQFLKGYCRKHTPYPLKLVQQLLERLDALVTEEQNSAIPFSACDLETLANLAFRLSCFLREPAASSPEKQSILNTAWCLLQRLQPSIQRKSVKSGTDSAENCGSHIPTLTGYQLLLAYDLAIKYGHSKDGQASVLKIKQWLAQLLLNQGTYIVDASNYSWGKIAQLEAEYGLDDGNSLLDYFVDKYQSSLPAAKFNPKWLEIFAQLPTPAASPPPEAGVLILPNCDLRGQPVKADNRRLDYCVLGRLSQGTLRLIEVALPQYPSHYLRSQLIPYDGMWYRMDLLGGNRMKVKNPNPQALLSGNSEKQPGKLLAFPLQETQADGAFAEFIAKLFTYQESFFYGQRALLATPYGSTVDSVLEGTLSVAIFPDQNDGQPHAFKLQQNIQLCPHDGCGFIKMSVASRMGSVHNYPLKKTVPREFNYLPAQALQHYQAASLALEEEFTVNGQRLIEMETSDDKQLCFNLLQSGGVRGSSLLALPAADNRLHTPIDRSATSGVMLGRAPYHKPNLYAISAEQIETTSATANFLKAENLVLQYSLLACELSKTLWFAKGLAVVIADQYWPPEYMNCDMVLSAEDIKLHGRWENGRIREQQITHQQISAMLTVIDIFPTALALAVPPTQQKQLDGDFDGDHVLLLDGYPQLYQHIVAAKHSNPITPTKPEKTFTPATAPQNGYLFGRGKQIAELLGNSMLQTFTTLQRGWLALKMHQRCELALIIMQKIVQKFKMDKLLNWVEQVPINNQTSADSAVLTLLSQGIHLGTDSYKTNVPLEAFAAMGKQLVSFFAKNGISTCLPYSKKQLCQGLAQNVTAFITESTAQLTENPTLAAAAMRANIDNSKVILRGDHSPRRQALSN